jgi:hypothetical protein
MYFCDQRSKCIQVVFLNAFRSIFLLWYTYIIFLRSNSLSLSSSFIGSFLKYFLCNPNHSVSCPSINLYKLLGNFSDFFYSLFSLVCEHSLIFRCSKISYHELQILYLGFSCSIMSLRIFPEFSELSEYFSRLK